MTFSKAWLEKKIMCGLCNFGCCNHPSFHVEITEEEQEFYQKEYGLDLELEWLQDGCCKLYPLVENKSNRMVINNWGYLHCPKPDNYELDKVVDGKYHYKLKKKHKNKRDKLILDDKIENVVKQIWLQSKDSILQKYGQEYYEKIKMEMKQTIKHEFF